MRRRARILTMIAMVCASILTAGAARAEIGALCSGNGGAEGTDGAFYSSCLRFFSKLNLLSSDIIPNPAVSGERRTALTPKTEGGSSRLLGQPEDTPAPQNGATLAAASSDGLTYRLSGSGFRGDETVNIRVVLPHKCLRRAKARGDAFYQGLLDKFSAPTSVTANQAGGIGLTIAFRSDACHGSYAVSALAPGSGKGAHAEIVAGTRAMIQAPGRLITATPDAVDALNPVLTILGTGWDNSAKIVCRAKRPDGHRILLGSTQADTNGTFALDVRVSGPYMNAPDASEEAGVWTLTCRTPDSGEIAVTGITVHAVGSAP